MGRDPSVQLILRDTLDTFERDKKSDVNLDALMEMWSKEKTKMVKAYGQGVTQFLFFRHKFSRRISNTSLGSYWPEHTGRSS